MENKKQYIAPALKCVEFKVERGFLGSNLTQGLRNWESKPDNLTIENFGTYCQGDRPFQEVGPHGGFFSGDISDSWD